MKNIQGIEESNRDIRKIVRESIRTSLIDLMDESDYNRISVTDICRKAGVSRTGFYRNFRTKEDIVDDIIREILNGIIETAGTVFDKNREGRTEWYKKYLEYVNRNISVYKVLFRSGFHHRYLHITNTILMNEEPKKSGISRFSAVIWNGGIFNATYEWVYLDRRVSDREFIDNLVRSLDPILESEKRRN